MLKTLFTILLGLLILQRADAQKKPSDRDTLIYYLKNSGIVTTADSADYALFIMPRDPADKKSFFPVFEYYPNGKRKLTAASSTHSLQAIFEGACVSFFPNGKRESIMNYRNGTPFGDVTEYYPNGKLYATKRYDPNGKLYYLECRDSTGNVLAENGNGKWIEFDDNFKAIIRQGTFTNGMLSGGWAKIDANGKLLYEISQQPSFPGGLEVFGKFLAKNIRYPSKDFQNHLEGQVILQFVVEKDGSLTDLKAVKGPSQTMMDEAVRVMKLSPLWKPGFANGNPARVAYTIPINFSLGGR